MTIEDYKNKQYSLGEIKDLLNSLKRHDSIEHTSGYMSHTVIEECEYGDYVKLEDVAALFNLIANTWTNENPVGFKVLP
jgi:hypothetical protein